MISDFAFHSKVFLNLILKIDFRERQRERGRELFFALRASIQFPKVMTLGDLPGEDINRIFILFSGVSFQGHGQGVISQCSWL